MKNYNCCLKQLIHAYAILPERFIKKADVMTVIMWIYWGSGVFFCFIANVLGDVSQKWPIFYVWLCPFI